MLRGEFLKLARALGFEVDFHQPPVERAALASYEAGFFTPRDECYHAVVLQLQAFSQFSNRRPIATGESTYVQHQQILLRCEPGVAGGGLGKMQKAPQLVAEFGEGFVLGFLHVWASECRRSGEYITA